MTDFNDCLGRTCLKWGPDGELTPCGSTRGARAPSAGGPAGDRAAHQHLR